MGCCFTKDFVVEDCQAMWTTRTSNLIMICLHVSDEADMCVVAGELALSRPHKISNSSTITHCYLNSQGRMSMGFWRMIEMLGNVVVSKVDLLLRVSPDILGPSCTW